MKLLTLILKRRDSLLMKKDIIFILPDLETGGAERIVTTIANHLPREKFVPKLMLLRKEGGYLQLLRDDVEVIDLGVQRIRYSIPFILRELMKRKPDIVFSGFGEVNAYLSLFIKLFPKIKFVARETNVVSEHVKRKEIRLFYRFYNNYHKIICQSDDMEADLQENFGVKQEKMVKINNPIDFDFIDQQLSISSQPQALASEEFDVKDVLAIGNLSSRKGFDNLLRVFSFLRDEPIRLHILGDGREREQLSQLKEHLGLSNVFFHGRQPNPYQYFKYADLFILSSRYEGFPNVLLEAGACGVYSLANDCPGGIREIIQPGVNGEIHRIEDYERFAERIKQVLKDIYDKEKIKASIRMRFSKEIILGKYEEVLGNL